MSDYEKLKCANCGNIMSADSVGIMPGDTFFTCDNCGWTFSSNQWFDDEAYQVDPRIIELLAIKKKNKELEENKEIPQKQIDHLKVRNGVLETQIFNDSREIEELRNVCKENGDLYDRLKGEINQRDVTIKDLAHDANSRNIEIANLKQDITNRNITIHSKEEEINNLKLKDLKWNESFTCLQNQFNGKNELINTLMRDIDGLKADKRLITKNKEAYNQKCEIERRLRTEKNELRLSLIRSYEDYEKLDLEPPKARWKRQKAEMKAKIKQLNKRVDTKKYINSMLDDKIGQLEKEKEQTWKAIEQERKELTLRAEQELDSCSREASRYINKLQNEIHDLKSKDPRYCSHCGAVLLFADWVGNRNRMPFCPNGCINRAEIKLDGSAYDREKIRYFNKSIKFNMMPILTADEIDALNKSMQK